MTETYEQRLGRRIRELRTPRFPNQVRFGAAIGMGKSDVSRIENGKRGVNSRLLRRIADVLGVRVDEILPDEHPAAAMAHAPRKTDTEQMLAMIKWAKELRSDLDLVAHYVGRP